MSHRLYKDLDVQERDFCMYGTMQVVLYIQFLVLCVQN